VQIVTRRQRQRANIGVIQRERLGERVNNPVLRMDVLMIRFTADAIVVVHLAFVLWVILGSLLVGR